MVVRRSLWLTSCPRVADPAPITALYKYTSARKLDPGIHPHIYPHPTRSFHVASSDSSTPPRPHRPAHIRTKSGSTLRSLVCAPLPQTATTRAAARARDGHGRRMHGFSTARAVSKRPVKWLKKSLTGRHGQRHGRNGYTGLPDDGKKTSRSTAVTAVFQRAVKVQTRAVPVPLNSGKNGRRNGHGTRATGAVEPWPRAQGVVPAAYPRVAPTLDATPRRGQHPPSPTLTRRSSAYPARRGTIPARRPAQHHPPSSATLLGRSSRPLLLHSSPRSAPAPVLALLLVVITRPPRTRAPLLLRHPSPPGAACLACTTPPACAVYAIGCKTRGLPRARVRCTAAGKRGGGGYRACSSMCERRRGDAFLRKAARAGDGDGDCGERERGEGVPVRKGMGRRGTPLHSSRRRATAGWGGEGWERATSVRAKTEVYARALCLVDWRSRSSHSPSAECGSRRARAPTACARASLAAMHPIGADASHRQAHLCLAAEAGRVRLALAERGMWLLTSASTNCVRARVVGCAMHPIGADASHRQAHLRLAAEAGRVRFRAMRSKGRKRRFMISPCACPWRGRSGVVSVVALLVCCRGYRRGAGVNTGVAGAREEDGGRWTDGAARVCRRRRGDAALSRCDPIAVDGAGYEDACATWGPDGGQASGGQRFAASGPEILTQSLFHRSFPRCFLPTSTTSVAVSLVVRVASDAGGQARHSQQFKCAVPRRPRCASKARWECVARNRAGRHPQATIALILCPLFTAAAGEAHVLQAGGRNGSAQRLYEFPLRLRRDYLSPVTATTSVELGKAKLGEPIVIFKSVLGPIIEHLMNKEGIYSPSILSVRIHVTSSRIKRTGVTSTVQILAHQTKCLLSLLQSKSDFTIAVDTPEDLANSFKTPFLEPISNTAKSLLTAVQTVKQNKSDCTQLLEQTYGLLYAIVSLHMKPETGSDLSPSILNHLGKFTDTLYKIHTFVEAQQDKSKIRHFFRQGEMSKLLKDCNMGLQEALDHFKLQDINLLNEVGVMQKFAEDRHQEVLDLIDDFSDGATSDKGSLTSISMLPSEPKIFHGRESELSDILTLFMQETLRIAMLGAGGMGKTSLARAVLHHPTVTGKYAQHRFFVACDSTSSTDELAILIGAHVGMKPKKDLAKVILHHFTTNPACLLVLDNLETLWESTKIRRDIEEFLSLLTDVKHLALIDAARQTFIDIADDCHDSEDIDKVLLLTDNMSLAIDLMAHLIEYIELVQSKLPVKDILRCKAALVSTSLAYSDDQRRLKTLAPIREYVARSYPPMDSLVQGLLNYFHQLLKFKYKYSGTVSASEMTIQITSNFSNIQGLLLNRLQHQNPTVDIIYCTIYFNGFRRLAGRGQTPLMDHIVHIRLLPCGLEVFLIAEIFSSWQYHPIPDPMVLAEQAIKQFPHFDDLDLKCLAYLQRCMGDPAAGQIYASEAQRQAKISADLYNEAWALESEAQCWHTLGNYKYAASLCARGRNLRVHRGMSTGGLDNVILGTHAEIYKLKSEYVVARDINRQILDRAPVELEAYTHASTVLNIAEVEVFLDVPMEDVERKIDTAKSIFNSLGHVAYTMACDATMGSLHLREINLQSAKSLLTKCLSFFWGNQAGMVNHCLERLGDGSLWGSTDWSSSWTIVYLVHSSKSQQKLDVHKALQFLADIFFTEGDQNTAENGHVLKATQHWKSARSLFERSSQAKKVALIDEELLSITGDVLREYTRSLTLLSDIDAPSAALETTTGSLVEEIGETENPGLSERKELVPVTSLSIYVMRPGFSSAFQALLNRRRVVYVDLRSLEYRGRGLKKPKKNEGSDQGLGRIRLVFLSQNSKDSGTGRKRSTLDLLWSPKP
ncbi:hypothetical protein DFH09DRAFT_1392762 [Mycena vulgaris]|nr:hypothetical protein DFH09DRAFT_1392762 [Mycena vulgaris]